VIRRTRVHSDVLRVTFFTRIQEFSWNRIIRVNPLPRGASVGELGKNLTPSKRWVCRNSWDKFADHSQHENSSFVKAEHSWRDPDGLLSVFSGFQVMCENDSRIWVLRVNLLSISGWLKPTKTWNLERAKLWNLELVKTRNQEPVKFWSLKSTKIGNYNEWWFSWIRDSRIRERLSHPFSEENRMHLIRVP
jgi:hypothetical protein